MRVDLYNILIDVSLNVSTPEEALIQILELQKTVTKIEGGEVYSGQNIRNCKLAIYEIFWKSGGSSVAAIGFTHDGTRWIAPTNWTFDQSSPSSTPATLVNDEVIESIDKIVLLFNQNRR